ncbi:hypothetical protein GCM10025792_14790 [Pseudonocardia tropica]
MHLHPADVLLAHQHLVLVLHPLVAGAGGDVVTGQVDQWHRPGRDDTQPQRFGRLAQPGTQASHVGAQLVQRRRRGRVGLDQRPLQLGEELGAVQVLQQPFRVGRGPAVGQADHVELLLDPHQRHVPHGR